jgi:hypothetical protein
LIAYGKLREEDEGYCHREQINTGGMAATMHQVIMPRVVPGVRLLPRRDAACPLGLSRSHTLRGARA